METGYNLRPPQSGFPSCKRALKPLCACLSNHSVVYQLCCEEVRSVQDQSVLPCPFPVLLASNVSSRSQRTNCCFPADMESRVPALGRSLSLSPGHCSSGSSSWEGTRQGHMGCRHHVVFKSLPGPGWQQEKGWQQLLPVCHWPPCVWSCVCVCVCLSPWKRTATPARICYSDLLLPLGLKGFSDLETKPSR